jgi:hypothetical protein
MLKGGNYCSVVLVPCGNGRFVARLSTNASVGRVGPGAVGVGVGDDSVGAIGSSGVGAVGSSVRAIVDAAAYPLE